MRWLGGDNTDQGQKIFFACGLVRVIGDMGLINSSLKVLDNSEIHSDFTRWLRCDKNHHEYIINSKALF